eukprot:4067316-Prymnesium_polylepis.1
MDFLRSEKAGRDENFHWRSEAVRSFMLVEKHVESSTECILRLVGALRAPPPRTRTQNRMVYVWRVRQKPSRR